MSKEQGPGWGATKFECAHCRRKQTRIEELEKLLDLTRTPHGGAMSEREIDLNGLESVTVKDSHGAACVAEPCWAGNVPFHEDACPSFDGKRCAAIGARPGAVCEPVTEIVVASLRTTRAAAAIGRDPKPRNEEE